MRTVALVVFLASSLVACGDDAAGGDTSADSASGDVTRDIVFPDVIVDTGQPLFDTVTDTAVADTTVADTAVADTAVADTTVADTAVADTAVADTGVADTGVADTGVADTAVADTAVADTAVADTAVPSCAFADAVCVVSEFQGSAWVCVDDWDGDDLGVCRSACDSAGVACAGGLSCLTPVDSDLGFCGPSSCGSFFGTECGPGTHCLVADGQGDCFHAGAVAEGGVCANNGDCRPGLVCLGEVCTVPECSADNTTKPCVDAGEHCQAYTIGDAVSDMGECAATCVPFVSPDSCAVGQWCMPDLLDASVGECVDDDGDVPVGGVCGDSAGGCDAGGLCLASGLAGECAEICDPAAAAGAAGACAPGQGCAGLRAGDVDLAIGYCEVTCDYHGDASCAGTGELCQAGEIFDAPFDVCVVLDPAVFPAGPLDVGATCPGAATAGDLCGSGRACLDTGSGTITCEQMCFTSQGAFGSQADCATGAVCTDVNWGDALGLCF